MPVQDEYELGLTHALTLNAAPPYGFTDEGATRCPLPPNRAAVSLGVPVIGPVWPNVTVPDFVSVLPLPDESAALVDPTPSFNFHHPDDGRAPIALSYPVAAVTLVGAPGTVAGVVGELTLE